MCDELRNKRVAIETVCEANAEENNEKSMSLKHQKVAIISASSNIDNIEDCSVLRRDDNSTVIFKIKTTPTKGKFEGDLNEADLISIDSESENTSNFLESLLVLSLMVLI